LPELVNWEAKYRNDETGWDRGGPNPALATWLAADALPHGRALVPGCGRGHEVLVLAEAGWAVTAIDSAPSAVRALDERLNAQALAANVEQVDLFDWTPANGSFDLIYEQTCLCALPPKQWPAYVERLAQWLRPGGTLAALFMQTGKSGGPPFDCPLDAMAKLFKAPVWEWDDTNELHSPHPVGLEERGILLRRGT